MTPQVPPLQTGLPFVGSLQASQPVAVQPAATLLFATQILLAPVPQRWNPALQLGTHIPAWLHSTEPLAGTAQAPQPFIEQPDATLLLATQVVPHRWKPVLQARTQAPAALQVTVPLAGAVQTVQLLPHEVMLVLPLMTQLFPHS